MNTPLTIEHINPFPQSSNTNGKISTAVLVYKNKFWFLGGLQSARFDKEVFLLRLENLIKIKPTRDCQPEEAEERIILPENDKAIEYQELPLPFKLTNVVLATPLRSPEKTLHIRFDGGYAILSTRPQDLEMLGKCADTA